MFFPPVSQHSTKLTSTFVRVLCLILLLSGDYDAAIREHQQELSLCEVLNDVIGRAVAHRKIGECYAEMGNIEAALKVSPLICFFKKCLQEQVSAY